MANRLTQKATFLSYLIIMFLLSLIPSSNFTVPLWKYDKIIHFCEYLIMGFLLFNCLAISINYKKQMLYCFIFAILISTIDEFIIQNYFGKGRVPDIYDWIVDVFAAGIGIILRKISPLR